MSEQINNSIPPYLIQAGSTLCLGVAVVIQGHNAWEAGQTAANAAEEAHNYTNRAITSYKQHSAEGDARGDSLRRTATDWEVYSAQEYDRARLPLVASGLAGAGSITFAWLALARYKRRPA